MRANGPTQRDEQQADVSPVATLVQGNGLPTLPRVLVVALAVGAIAFLAGVQLGAGRTADRPLPTASPAMPSASPSPLPSVTALPVTAAPGTSLFAENFMPPNVTARLDGGAKCVSHAHQVPDPGPVVTAPNRIFVEVWTIFCPLKPQARRSFVQNLIVAIDQQSPNQGYSVFSDLLGSATAIYPYTQGPFVGTVTLAADAAGSGFEIVITLEERLAQ